MRDQWYADKRDLIKWSALLLLAREAKADRVIQIALYNQSKYGDIDLDGQRHSVPEEVLAHFRDLRTVVGLTQNPRISVFASPFLDRKAYFRCALSFVASFANERCVVFLDPDTGLEPANGADAKHVLDQEAGEVWSALTAGTLFVFYQHKTNQSAEPWIEPKREQLAKALGVALSHVKIASGPGVAHDVVLYYATKS